MASLGSAGTIGAIASAAAMGLKELFKDDDYPFAKAVIRIKGGAPTAESSLSLMTGRWTNCCKCRIGF